MSSSKPCGVAATLSSEVGSRKQVVVRVKLGVDVCAQGKVDRGSEFRHDGRNGDDKSQSALD